MVLIMSSNFTKAERTYQNSKPYTFRELEDMLKGLESKYREVFEENRCLKIDVEHYEKLFKDAKNV